MVTLFLAAKADRDTASPRNRNSDGRDQLVVKARQASAWP
jgi:ribosomal protein S30